MASPVPLAPPTLTPSPDPKAAARVTTTKDLTYLAIEKKVTPTNPRPNKTYPRSKNRKSLAYTTKPTSGRSKESPRRLEGRIPVGRPQNFRTNQTRQNCTKTTSEPTLVPDPLVDRTESKLTANRSKKKTLVRKKPSSTTAYELAGTKRDYDSSTSPPIPTP